MLGIEQQREVQVRKVRRKCADKVKRKGLRQMTDALEKPHSWLQLQSKATHSTTSLYMCVCVIQEMVMYFSTLAAHTILLWMEGDTG